ncbi:MAG: biosynthetic-type acetolactate synthase large subunit [Candidatus Ancaeobacter aquaticus]|nr:biosynthetic-type acetolactate synthase large subunit [Candidatus Ancaeobacter aquaticus]
MRTGAEIVIDSLAQENVEVVFGYPGGTVIDIFDLMNKAPFEFVLVRHEQAAAHAADGYARSTGKVGVCLATSGPGATNLVTGIATANMDGIPMVAITGQVPSSMIGNDAFQEVDITGICRPITKHTYLVKDIDELPRIIKEAFYIASTGKPGPVLIDIPKDVQKAKTKNPYPKEVDIRGYKPTFEGHSKQIEKVAEIIAKSKKPVIYAGGGVISSNAAAELFDLVTKAQIPVTTTLMGLGGFPDTHELSLKMLGMHGTRYANYAVMEADLILAIGARFDDRVTGKIDEFAPHAKIVHVDIDPSSISKNVRVDIPVVGDVKRVLQSLNKIVKKADSESWLKQIAQWKSQYPLSYVDDDLVRPQYVIEQIWELTKGDAIITTEVGQNQMWATQFYKYTKPRTFISSGGLGTMGYGFPAAIGAQIAHPDKLVIDIAGDGSIQMNIQELTTAVINDLPVKVVILNNRYLGMVRQWQELFYDKNYSATCSNRTLKCPKICDANNRDCPPFVPDFVKVAEAFGAVGMRVDKKKDVIPTLKKAFEIKKPVFMDFTIEREENVFPMVPAGVSLAEMIGGLA